MSKPVRLPGSYTEDNIVRNRYVVALSILGAYFVASYFILHVAIEEQRAKQRIIAVSGQQRMYAQRIVLFADAIVARPDAARRMRARRDLETSIRIFDAAHTVLTRGDPVLNPTAWTPHRVRNIFFDKPNEVDRHVRAYLAHARALDARAGRQKISPRDADLDYLLTVGPDALLKSLDAVVAAYNAEQRAGAARFELLQLGLLGLGLSTLGMIWLTILLPMEREIVRRTAAMERIAATDALTNVLNRTAFATAVESAVSLARRAGDAGAMLMIDVDNFKAINDSYGHVVGDETIVRVAEIMRANSRVGDVVARFGGDEFAIFAPSFDSERSLRAFVERLCTALQFDIVVGTATHRVTASIGVVRYPHDADTLDELLHASDEALYVAKRAGRARHAFWAPRTPDASQSDEALVGDCC
ncbi:MAG: hypothetical protein NVSMB59_18570 [Vulcanimicrobiaceae bacterium]